MSVIFFEDDEAGYSRWLEANPTGFVANMEASKNPSYLVLHSSTCPTITPGKSRSNVPGAATSRDYRKACASDGYSLMQWGLSEGFDPKAIKICAPCASRDSTSAAVLVDKSTIDKDPRVGPQKIVGAPEAAFDAAPRGGALVGAATTVWHES